MYQSYISMKVLIIYDSIFGNTEQIAQAIGNAFGSQLDVEILRVGDVKPEQMMGVKLLIVGSPTRGFRPTPAIKSLLKKIPVNGLKAVKVTVFDTRISVSDIESRIGRFFMNRFGYAAHPIADWLTTKGGELILAPEGFVKDTEGPLKDGELERAEEWARKIMAEQ
jgi:flavodoxin